MSIVKCKVIKAPKGYHIEKTWEINEITGKIKPDSTVYTVFTNDFDGIIDSYRNIEDARRACRLYMV